MQYSETYRLPANEGELHPREEMEKTFCRWGAGCSFV